MNVIALPQTKKPTQVFPVLKKCNKHNFIVLFTALKQGTVVFDQTTFYGIGQHRNDWVSTEFEDWYGQVILEEEKK